MKIVTSDRPGYLHVYIKGEYAGLIRYKPEEDIQLPFDASYRTKERLGERYKYISQAANAIFERYLGLDDEEDSI